MFLKMIFKKIGLKENKMVMAGTYGFIYALLFFIVIFLSQIYLGKVRIKTNISFSAFIFVMMFIIYLIKWEFFNFGRDSNKKN